MKQAVGHERLSMFTLPRIIIGFVALAVVAVVAGGAIWWFTLRSDAELATNAPAIPSDLVSTPGSGDVADPAGSAAYSIISERSKASYFVDEKLAALPLPSTASGSTSDITGAFYLTEDGFGLDASRPSTFTVDLTTLTSDRAMRDRRVQNDGLQTATYPTATFTATGVSGVDPNVPAGEEAAFQLTGILDLHGVQREVTWDVKARREGNVITALATTNFRFEDFNIPVLNIAGFVSVEDDVTLQVEIVAEAAG
jgi:polyisoprenoid-binding protein YceI